IEIFVDMNLYRQRRTRLAVNRQFVEESAGIGSGISFWSNRVDDRDREGVFAFKQVPCGHGKSGCRAEVLVAGAGTYFMTVYLYVIGVVRCNINGRILRRAGYRKCPSEYLRFRRGIGAVFIWNLAPDPCSAWNVSRPCSGQNTSDWRHRDRISIVDLRIRV